MPSTYVTFVSDDPNASYRHLLDRLLAEWHVVMGDALVDLVLAHAAPMTYEEQPDVVVDPMMDDGGFVVPIADLALLGGPAGQGAVLEVQCHPVLVSEPAEDEQSPPSTKRVGRRVVVALHPHDPSLDLGSVVALTALLVRAGEPVERPGWAAAFRLPGTAWIGGFERDAPVALGLVGAEPLTAAAEDRQQWEQKVQARLAQAEAVVTASGEAVA
jgi:hypothetical protein